MRVYRKSLSVWNADSSFFSCQCDICLRRHPRKDSTDSTAAHKEHYSGNSLFNEIKQTTPLSLFAVCIHFVIITDNKCSFEAEYGNASVSENLLQYNFYYQQPRIMIGCQFFYIVLANSSNFKWHVLCFLCRGKMLAI